MASAKRVRNCYGRTILKIQQKVTYDRQTFTFFLISIQ